MSNADREDVSSSPAFGDLGLAEALLQALSAVGYETPSPIQAATIPPLLEGRDVLGQAQTGTGKTAAFALPILSRLDLSKSKPQALVLAPTRELAIQVAEAFQRYASHLPGFHVLPIYGGQSYGPQLAGLRRGAHVVVGTPGRVIDHLERGSLDLSGLTTLVLDEADEMLRMGFIDDVETVLKKTPPERQVALFSATMPAPIRRIAQTYLREPAEITIKAKTTTATNIRQRYWYVSGVQKLDALTRILEAEPFEAMIVFARTKQATEELAGKLQARGFDAAAINGDIVQAQRERLIQQLKDGKLDILVATDVAARGLDVERISHVLNYDIPTDTEAYVHRIGRTGRAGRSGEAILFVAPREKRLLMAIERATRQPIAEMQLPSVEAVNDQRITKFKQRIADALAADDLGVFRQLIEQFEQERNVPAIEIAAALARLAQGGQPLLLEAPARFDRTRAFERDARGSERPSRERGEREPRGARERGDERERQHRGAAARSSSPSFPRTREALHDGPQERPSTAPARSEKPADARARGHDVDKAPGAAAPRPHRDAAPHERPAHMQRDETARPARTRRDEATRAPESGFETFRIEVGNDHGVKPGNIVGAIANEAGLDSKHIGRVDIRDDHSFVDLPEGMPSEIFKHLKKVWVSGQQLRITRGGDAPESGKPRKPHAAKPPSFRPKPQGGFDKPKRRPKG
ncbi:DEAD/DEAH box helicase [Dokdonella ginsengisoli]|uniref:ATP-dependent RNA helicase DeaD n=1 Tax=Dokdonella ginsengisoli TaxID=363846 RepID=A0ABV9QTE2_9GAMM